MKKVIFKFATVAVFLTSSSSLYASASNGVICTGTTPEYRNSVLKCSTTSTRTYTLGSMCPPINRPLNIVMNSRGRDTCSAVLSGNRVTSAKTPPLPGYPSINRFRRVVSNTRVDKFVAEVTSKNYKHPRGKRYTHNARQGVTCSRGYSPRYTRGRLTCKKSTVKHATCDIGWRLEVRPNRNSSSKKDVCVMRTPLGAVTGNYTIPAGTTGATGNPSRYGWRLKTRDGRDNWEKVKYKYPVAAR